MTNRSPGQIGLPPPATWRLIDGDRVVGWTADTAVGFRGFGNPTEAVHAAWVAYRALALRLARTHGTRPVPIDGAALAIQRRDEREWILADGRPIATLVRPNVEIPSEPSYGFEIEIPHAADDLQLRSLAHLMYRTLRRSGLRWALWRSDGGRDPAPRAAARVGDRSAMASPVGLTTADASGKRRRRGWTLPLPKWTLPVPKWTLPVPKWTLPVPKWTLPASLWRRSRGRRPSYAGGTND